MRNEKHTSFCDFEKTVRFFAVFGNVFKKVRILKMFSCKKYINSV